MQKSSSNSLTRVTRHSYSLQASLRSAVTYSRTLVIASLFLIGKGRPKRSSLSADKSSWKAIGDRLQRPNYLSRVDHERKISNRRQRTDIRKYSFVNRTIRLWNRLPAEILGTLPVNQMLLERGLGKWLMWWTEGNMCWKLTKSVVKRRLVQWRGVNRDVPWRVFTGGEVKCRFC